MDKISQAFQDPALYITMFMAVIIYILFILIIMQISEVSNKARYEAKYKAKLDYMKKINELNEKKDA